MSMTSWLKGREIAPVLGEKSGLGQFPLTWNRSGPLSVSATHGIVRLGWPGEGAGRSDPREWKLL